MSRRVELVLLHGSSASIPLHLNRMISSHLGPDPNMTLSETCSFSSIALMDWMWEASCTRVSERTPCWSFTNFLRSDPHYYRYQFAEAMKVAAKRGDVAVVGWLLDHFQGCVVPGEAVEWAADNGHLHGLKLLWDHDGGRFDRERNDAKKRKVVTRSGDVLAQSSPGHNAVQWNSSSVVRSFCSRHRDVVRWLHEHIQLQTNEDLASSIWSAVRNDDWELARCLLPPGRCLLDYCASSTNPRMIEWMLDCGYLQRDNIIAIFAIIELAGSSKHLPLMRRIADQHKVLDSLEWYDEWRQAMDKACESGEFKVFRWLAGHPTGVRVCADVKQDEERFKDFPALVLRQNPADVDFLQYLYEQDLFGEDYLYPLLPAAISGGQPLEVLKWLVDHTDPDRLPGYCVMNSAAASGRLEILQYFQRLQLSAFTRNTFYPSDEEDSGPDADVPLWCTTKAMDKAAANGHLKVVKWLHVSRPEGCTVAAMDGAARNGHLEVVKWLHVNRSEDCSEATMDGAAANGHLKMLKWLRANMNAGCTTVAMDRAASRGFLDVIKWLSANTSAGCTTDAMDNAASGGHLETLKWLHGNTSEGCTARAISSALRSRHFRVASWLHERYPECLPTKLIRWIYGGHSFEELLFREEHYGDIFTSDFLHGLKDPSREDSSYETGEAWSWVKEKYLGT